MIDISILCPSVRINNIPHVYKTISDNIGPYTFELVVVSPFAIGHFDLAPPTYKVKFVQDCGSANRAMQIAGYMAEGHLVMNAADDATFLPGLKTTIDQYYENECTKHQYMIAVQYTEDYRPRMRNYWITHTHDDLRLPTVPNTTFSAVHLCSRWYWHHLGGYDCIYQNPNFSCIEFMLRAIKEGGVKIELSQEVAYDVKWTQGDSETIRKPVHFSTLEEDIPLFKKRAQEGYSTCISVDNWKNSPPVWKRRFPE